MKRITKDRGNGFYELAAGAEIYGEDRGIRLIQIVGVLEDIGEELGIGLITLFLAVKNGFYDNEENYYKPYDYLIDLESSCLRENFEDYMKAKTFSFKDYGKTWALTKEELL